MSVCKRERILSCSVFVDVFYMQRKGALGALGAIRSPKVKVEGAFKEGYDWWSSRSLSKARYSSDGRTC